MLPFLAHGHLIPFLALARQIHQATGFKISIASTPLNIQYLSSTFNSSSDEPENDHIHLLELPFCSTDNDLPPNTENSENLSLDSIGKLLSASLSLRKPFHSLVSDIAAKQGHPPLCIISDVFLGWATEVANSLGTVNVTFATSGAYGTLASSSLWLNLPHRAASGMSTRRAGKKLEISIEKCIEWLESHSPASVLYISFGSQNTISPSQMMELAIGLEESAKPFVWVIRPPVGFEPTSEFRAEYLPEGFEERMEKRKQVDFSVGKLEPIIGWPLAAEQEM
ncbi:UDP-glycosyltransferase 92A1-like [Populus alba x Populus x berolinensis]|nr:UDP-glycosyltransferase 92A1-like [Populus alba x Populus x berolinensis]